MIYLAQPYSSPDPLIKHQRYIEAMKVTSAILISGQTIYSPIVHCHPMASYLIMPTDHNFWLYHDKEILKHCDSMAILFLDGWEQSRGLKEEIEFARENSIDFFEIDYVHSTRVLFSNIHPGNILKQFTI